MILRTISIKNFRAYKEFQCDFSDGINLVIGDNGTGKTSLLAAVAQLLAVQINSMGGALPVNISDPYTETKRVGDATWSVSESFPIEISGILDESGSKHTFGLVRMDFNNGKHNGDINFLSDCIKQSGSVWPLISYQRFDRDWKLEKNKDNVVVEIGINKRSDGYKECLKGVGQEEKIQKWCLKMSMLEFERKGAVREFERFKYIVKTFLQKIEDTEDEIEVDYSIDFSGLTMKKGGCVQPLYELSTGYKTLLSMIMELAYRTVLLNPEVDVENHNQTGIVIIDEIDAHLHPKWQWRVIDALKQAFPCVQFIIATHSPIVITSAKGANVLLLEDKRRALTLPDSYGYNIDDILCFRQGSLSRPKDIQEKMNKIEEAAEYGDFLKADEELLELKKRLGENNSEYKRMAAIVSDARMVEGI